MAERAAELDESREPDTDPALVSDLREALAGFIAVANIQGAKVPDDLIEWSLSVLYPMPKNWRPTVEVTRAAIAKLGEGK